MKPGLLAALALGFGLNLSAQVSQPAVIWTLSSPSGACAPYQPMELNISTATPSLWSCNSATSTWVQLNSGGGGGGGTVTSFSAGSLAPLFTTSVATATTTPALSFALSTQSANLVFAGPATGSAAAPTFRALAAADLPSGFFNCELAGTGSTPCTTLNIAYGSGVAATLGISGSVATYTFSADGTVVTYPALQSGSALSWITGGDTSTAYLTTVSPALTAYTQNMLAVMLPDVASGASPTISAGVGPIAIQKSVGGTPTAIAANDLTAGVPYPILGVGSPVSSFLAVPMDWTFAKLAKVNNAVVTTGPTGLPVESTTLPSGLTIPGFLSSTLNSANLFIGNGSNAATGVAASGDVSLANTGAFTVTQIEGGAIPVSAGLLGTNSSSQPVAATASAVGTVTYAAGGGTANAQTATLVPAPSSLTAGMEVCWLPTANNSTTTPTLAVNGLAAATITKTGQHALAANDLSTTQISCARYDGTYFELLQMPPNMYGTTLSLTSVIGEYDSLTTVGAGVPCVCYQINLTGQTAALANTTSFFTPPAAGFYRIYYYAKVTTAASTSSILGGTVGFQVLYTDATDSVAQTVTLPAFSQAGANLTISSGNTGNSTTTVSYGTAELYMKASTAATYGFGYTSVGGTAMAYELHVKVELIL